MDGGVVLDLAERLAAAGAGEVVLADTIGVGTPGRVRALVESLCSRNTKSIDGGSVVGGHFHDTRNTGVANAWAALEAGATVLDASVGGLGGCPFAPNSTGNVATEDVLYLLEREGVETGVDLDGVIATAHWLEGVLGRGLPGRVSRAGGFPVAVAQPYDGAMGAADEEELPAWSLPANALDAIRIPPNWPEHVDRDWAWGGATGAGIRVAIVDSGVERGHPLVGDVQQAVAVSGSSGADPVIERGRGRRHGRPRHRVRRHRPLARARVRARQRPRARRRLDRAAAGCSSPVCAGRSSRGSRSST